MRTVDVKLAPLMMIWSIIASVWTLDPTATARETLRMAAVYDLIARGLAVPKKPFDAREVTWVPVRQGLGWRWADGSVGESARCLIILRNHSLATEDIYDYAARGQAV
jgi:hypothetical protein